MNWQNLYENPQAGWFKGSLHNHTTPASPCGRVKLERVLELYEAAGFDFLSISDHLAHTVVTQATRLTLLPGMEWNSWEGEKPILTHNNHLGLYTLQPGVLEGALQHNTPEPLLRSLAGVPLLAVLNHPDWEEYNHYDVATLRRLYHIGREAGLTMGVEVHNDLTGFEATSRADASAKWDALLTETGPILGFASDDSHNEQDIGRAWLMVNAAECTPQAIFAALCAGRFYLSTGVEIVRLGREGDRLFCSAGEEVAIDVVGENGALLQEATGTVEVDCTAHRSKYIRFVLYGQGKQQAWSQPFYREAVQ